MEKFQKLLKILKEKSNSDYRIVILDDKLAFQTREPFHDVWTNLSIRFDEMNYMNI